LQLSFDNKFRVNGMQVKGSKVAHKNPNTIARIHEELGNNSARFSRKSKMGERDNRDPLVGSPKLANTGGRNHHKNSVESTKIPRPHQILKADQIS